MRNKVKNPIKHKIFYAVLLVLTLVLGTGCQKKMTVQDYLDLGDKYLTEANYEEAIVAFTKAIEVEPKAMKAYEGLANAYIKTENYEKAQDVLQSGISVYEGLTEDERTDEFRLIYEELLKLEEKIKLYLDAENSSDMEENENETLAETDLVDAEKEHLIAETKEKYGSILEKVLAEIRSQDPTYTHYFTDDFKSFVKSLEKPLIWQQEDGDYLGLYVGTDGDVYVYLGEMDNGIRSGYGSWYGEAEFTGEDGSSISAILFFGDWSEDYPNGSGTYMCDYHWDDGLYSRNKIQGNYQEGRENGTMNEDDIVTASDGSLVNLTCSYDVERGIPRVLYVDDEGDKIIAEGTETWEDGSDTWLYPYEDDIFGVDGAMKN